MANEKGAFWQNLEPIISLFFNFTFRNEQLV